MTDYAATTRQLTGAVRAVSVWRLADGSVIEQDETQEDYEAGKMEPPARGARFLLAWGGVPVLDTHDGRWHPGDVVEMPDGRVLVCGAEGEEYSYQDGAVAVTKAGRLRVVPATEVTRTRYGLTTTEGGIRLADGVVTVDDAKVVEETRTR